MIVGPGDPVDPDAAMAIRACVIKLASFAMYAPEAPTEIIDLVAYLTSTPPPARFPSLSLAIHYARRLQSMTAAYGLTHETLSDAGWIAAVVPIELESTLRTALADYWSDIRGVARLRSRNGLVHLHDEGTQVSALCGRKCGRFRLASDVIATCLACVAIAPKAEQAKLRWAVVIEQWTAERTSEDAPIGAQAEPAEPATPPTTIASPGIGAAAGIGTRSSS